MGEREGARAPAPAWGGASPYLFRGIGFSVVVATYTASHCIVCPALTDGRLKEVLPLLASLKKGGKKETHGVARALAVRVG